MTPPFPRADPLWYQDAIIYALHVKTFCDANGDGIGDFAGLTAKLDYLSSLGVTCVWLLPFYTSPLRDDGYDVADYEQVDARYGTLDDAVRFIEAAHERGLRVITELVINHTSDRHPWFQAARRAPAGSPTRAFYVWSDTDQRYLGARVIFHEAESSNWTWDPAAQQFYWHRFFHHQPDLNFDSADVRRAVIDVMRFWLARGVDGLRLDAVAHLFEREGTTCDNLPETHALLKSLRAVIDEAFPGRVLLAEANQSPADTRPYFGAGDECQMAFNFPLMPRLFIALKREEAAPIVEIVEQTRDLPNACQWAVFLRNHDELTLSTVTDEERRFLLAAYAADPRTRLNNGIRRRLAPLLENDRGRIELAHALLLSLPGSPVLYYGDEIGMGDNVALNDRDGLRTPMQWSDDSGAGFSRADPSTLVSPPIDDPVYGYGTVNVEAQQADPESLLAAITRRIRVRRKHQAFGRGTIELLECGNRRVLAFARRHAGATVLVVANLSSAPQPVAVELPGAAGLELVEMMQDVAFPAIGFGPYTLTLAPHACHWFQVVPAGAGSLSAHTAAV